MAGGARVRGDELGQARLARLILRGARGRGGDAPESGDVGIVKAEVVGADDFDLAHGNAADDLKRVFACADLQDQSLDFAERAFGGEAVMPVMKLPQRFNIGGEPGEAMDRVLLAFHERGGDFTLVGQLLAQARPGAVQQRFRSADEGGKDGDGFRGHGAALEMRDGEGRCGMARLGRVFHMRDAGWDVR